METNEEFIFPEIVDSAGNIAIDLTSLYSRTGILSYDYGLQSTAIWESSICSIDGKRGILTYRGYNIKELVRKNNFFDVECFLTCSSHSFLLYSMDIWTYNDSKQ